MLSQEEISLDCPYCHAELYRPLAWFKEPWFTCPACGGGLASGQFEHLIADIEEEIEACIAAELAGPQPGCGCGGCG